MINAKKISHSFGFFLIVATVLLLSISEILVPTRSGQFFTQATFQTKSKEKKIGWPRNQYAGPGGGAYTGPGGGLYNGPGGGAYTGPGGGLHTGPGGGLYAGPGGGLYTGPGGGLYTGPGGGLYTGPGGGLYTGPGGGLYTGPGGGMYTGADSHPYYSNIPPWDIFVAHLEQNGYNNEAKLIKKSLRSF